MAFIDPKQLKRSKFLGSVEPEKTRRFIIVQEENFQHHSYSVFVDRETGVHYVFTYKSYVEGACGGLTPLLGSDGKPLIAPVDPDYDDEAELEKGEL